MVKVSGWYGNEELAVMKTIDDLPVSGKRVLVRADLNVPLEDGRVADDARIRASLPTLTELAARDAQVIVCAHLGRPGGKPDSRYSLAPVAERLAELISRPVPLAADTAGPSARAAVAAMRPGDLVMLENLRFSEAETSKDDAVRGAFAGLLAVADEILVGGAMAFPFLVAQDRKVGTSLLDTGQVDAARDYLARSGGKIVLPSDFIVAAEAAAPAVGAAPEVAGADAIPADRMGLDIGPVSAESFAASLRTAGTVFWNGPMGRFEVPAYAAGTRAIARALAEGSAFTVIGGGDTAAAVHELGFPDSAFGYISTGGGASLEFIEGRTLPGIAALGG
jgi:phosphoglycerate kinase